MVRSKISGEVEGIMTLPSSRHGVDGDKARGGLTMDIPTLAEVEGSDLDAEGEPDDDI
jgi:hypothetical protein